MGSVNIKHALDIRRNLQGIAPPTSGEHKLGDIVWNSQPSPGGYAGWICVVAGTPGTWKGFGLIAL